jgi:hypothetical protein
MERCTQPIPFLCIKMRCLTVEFENLAGTDPGREVGHSRSYLDEQTREHQLGAKNKVGPPRRFIITIPPWFVR